MIRFIILIFFSLCVTACATSGYSPQTMSELEQGKRDFQTGYYRHAMHELLPLATDGVPEAQYAVGYMYYYGYGVTQDTEVGAFWIERAARKNYRPAIDALRDVNKSGCLGSNTDNFKLSCTDNHTRSAPSTNR